MVGGIPSRFLSPETAFKVLPGVPIMPMCGMGFGVRLLRPSQVLDP